MPTLKWRSATSHRPLHLLHHRLRRRLRCLWWPRGEAIRRGVEAEEEERKTSLPPLLCSTRRRRRRRKQARRRQTTTRPRLPTPTHLLLLFHLHRRRRLLLPLFSTNCSVTRKADARAGESTRSQFLRRRHHRLLLRLRRLGDPRSRSPLSPHRRRRQRQKLHCATKERKNLTSPSTHFRLHRHYPHHHLRLRSGTMI